jgi:hypothetical protein
MGFRNLMAGHAREAAYYSKDSRQYKSVMLPCHAAGIVRVSDRHPTTSSLAPPQESRFPCRTAAK